MYYEIKKWHLVMVLAVAFLFVLGATSSEIGLGGSSNCKTYTGTTFDEVGDEIYANGSGRLLDFQIEPDTAGANTGILVDTYWCTAAASDTCVLKELDSDFDGYPETSRWNGIGLTRGVNGIAVAGNLRFLVVGVGSGTPAIRICGRTS
jgi:hypothetical protein